MDWTTLTSDRTTAGSIANWLNNSLVAPMAPTFIAEAESMIYRRLRHFRMLTPPTTATMTVGSDQISLPSDFLDPYVLYLTANASVTGYGPTTLNLSTPEQVIARYAWDGTGTRINAPPSCYYFNGQYLQLDAPADQAYPYSLIYYAQPAALGATNTTNWLTQYYPRLLRCAVMAQACEWSKENNSGQYDRTYWLQLAQTELDAAQAESDFAKRSAADNLGMVAL